VRHIFSEIAFKPDIGYRQPSRRLLSWTWSVIIAFGDCNSLTLQQFRNVKGAFIGRQFQNVNGYSIQHFKHDVRYQQTSRKLFSWTISKCERFSNTATAPNISSIVHNRYDVRLIVRSWETLLDDNNNSVCCG
ncbi:hypothetical protein BDN72DRAFT_866517, partial [Pluteus cervinus]